MSNPINNDTVIVNHLLRNNYDFPNNDQLPLLVYQSAIRFTEKDDAADIIQEIFKHNKWVYAWRDGIFDFHHYHSTAHEVLGVYSGNCTAQFGGPQGVIIKLTREDVIIIPAGVAHKNLDSTNDFRCVGAYPAGQHYDMKYGKNHERPEADNNIRKVPLPSTDPVYGLNGKLFHFWHVHSSFHAVE